MADGYVQTAPDSTGKKIDNSELTRADGTVVERQRVVIADDTNPASQARVNEGYVLVRADEITELLNALLIELKHIHLRLMKL